MTDWTLISSYALAFIGGSGLTGIITTFYELNQRRKAKEREYFQKFVLRPELFKFLTRIMELFDILDRWLELKRTGSTLIYTDGELTRVRNQEELVPLVAKVTAENERTIIELRESGALFLMPANVRQAFDNLVASLPTADTANELTLNASKVLLRKATDSLTSALGIAKLP